MTFVSSENFIDNAMTVISDSLGDGVRVTEKYPSGTKPFPLDRVTVCISFKQADKKRPFIGCTDTEISAELEIGVFIPFSHKSDEAYPIMEKVLHSLENAFGFEQYKIGALAPNKSVSGFELYACVSAVLYETEVQ